MTFLNPAVLFGLFAAAIPVLIHLLNLRKLKRIEISTLYFLKELPKNKIRKIKLKQWLLLLLRTLIVIALVIAFARPTVRNLALTGASSTVKTTAVFILDDTFSMSVIDEKGSLFNQAKQLLQKHLASLQEGDDAAIIRVSETRVKDIRLSANLKSLAQSLDECSVSDVSGTINEALIKAAALLGTSNNFNKEVYIFTDMQKNSLLKDSLYTDLSEFFGERVNFYMFPFGGKPVDNMAIDSIRVNSAILQKDKTINISAYIRNYSETSRKNPVVSLFINGERVAQKVFSAPGKSKVEVNLEAVIKHYGFLNIVTALEDDAVNADNRQYASVNVPEKIDIGIFEKQKGDGTFLRVALQSDDSLRSLALELKPLSMLQTINPDRGQVVFVAGVDAAAQTDRLTSFIQNGGGVMIIPGLNTTVQDFNAFCGGMKLPGAAAIITQPSAAAPAAQFGGIDFEHPMLKGIFKTGEKKTVESPDITKYLSMNSGGLGKTIIKLNTNDPFLTEYRWGKGKLLVCASAFLPQWSNLPLKAFFIPLIYRSVFYLSARQSEDYRYYTGEPANIDLRGKTGRQIKIIRPGMQTEALTTGGGQGEAVEYKNTSKQGNYTVTDNNNTLAVFSMNHNPVESDISTFSTSDFREYLSRVHSKAKFHEIANMDKSLEEVKQARFGAELWKWFIFAALALAALEMWIARNSKKDIALH